MTAGCDGGDFFPQILQKSPFLRHPGESRGPGPRIQAPAPVARSNPQPGIAPTTEDWEPSDPAPEVIDMLEILEAEYVDGYTIRVSFNNGEGGLVDLAEALWGPMFEPLKDRDAFRKIRVSEVLHTICWDNDADLAPDYVYDRMVEQGSARRPGPSSASGGR